MRGGAAAPSRATIFFFLSSFTLGPVKWLRNKDYGEASGRAGEAGDRAALISQPEANSWKLRFSKKIAKFGACQILSFSVFNLHVLILS